MQLIGLLLAGMMIMPVLSAGLNSANHYLRVYIGESVAQRLRQELFDHLLHVRLAIARVLLQRPRLLLLDGATSAWDALTEQKMRVTIEKARAGRTAFVVAHRLTIILNADRILVIDRGRIVEMGSRTELLARQGLFFDLYLYQAQSLKSEQ